MDKLLKMAADSGMSKEQGEAATGCIFSLVKKQLASGDYNKIVKMIPEVDGLVKEHETSTKAATTGGAGDKLGSALAAAGGRADTAGGSAGGIASLLASLSSKGVTAKELNKFMPQVVSLVKSQCGVDIGKILGVSGNPPLTGEKEAPAGSSKNPIGRFMGMFGKKQKA